MKRGITQDKELMTLRIATLHDFTWEEEDRRGRGGKTTPLIFFPFFTLMKKVANKKIPPFVTLFTSASFLFKSIITPPPIYIITGVKICTLVGKDAKNGRDPDLVSSTFYFMPVT